MIQADVEPSEYLCKLDPTYCDRILARWEAYAQGEAERVVCG